MKLSGVKIIYWLPLGALLLALLAPMAAFGQASGSAGSSINVTRTPYLSFNEIPTSFVFSSVPASNTATHVFSSPDGPLGTGKAIILTDTRNSGGFIVQAQAGNFVNGAENFSPSNLRMVSTSDLSYPLDSFTFNHVHYLSGYTGIPTTEATQNIIAPVNAADTNFSQTATFDAVQNLPQNISLDAPVDVLKGCLTSSQGRNGTVAVGLSFDLNVPPYTLPGSYHSVITYTIMDYTMDPCP